MKLKTLVYIFSAVLTIATLASQGQSGDGVVTSTISRWASNNYGDQLIVTDVEITDNRGGRHLITIDGGKVGNVELFSSQTSRLRRGQRVYIHGSKATPVVENGAVFGRWPTSGPIPYYVNTNSVRLTPDESLAAIVFAANVWPSQSQANISAAYAGSTSGITIGNNHKSEVFFRTDSDTSYVGQTLVWAENGVFVDADMVFNESYLLLAGDVPCSGGVWIEDIGAHEFGHFFGLSHSSVTEATMYPSTSYCSQNWRTLAEDDIETIESNYPTVNNPPPSPPPTEPTISALTYKVKGLQRVDLMWSGFTSSLDIYRDGILILSATPNDGSQTDVINRRGSGSYRYHACETGQTTICADTVAIF